MEDNVDRHGGQEAEECRTRRSKGMSSRGKGVFSSNFPELVTEVAPLVTEVPTSLECEDPQSEMGEEGRVVLAANDRHQDVADGRKQQLVDYQPSLTEERGGDVPAWSLCSSRPRRRAVATAPGSRESGGYASPMRSIVVVDGLEFRITGSAGRGHCGTAVLMPMASDLSYFT